MKRAAAAFTAGVPLREVSRDFNIDRATLRRFIVKSRGKADEDILTGYSRLSKSKCVFPLQMENDLAQHIKDLSDQFHGLSVEKCRALAYEFAKRNDTSVPANWDKEQKAGKDWFYAFRDRHKLAVRAPEPTSLARASAFNRHNVDQFYNNLAAVMDRYKFSANDIWNLDETGCTTVQNPGKVVTQRGKKQVGSLTSAERGELVTLEYCVNAVGNMIPPLFVFPRVNFREHFLNGAPTGAIGRASRSGWMNEDLFSDFMQHFMQHTRCTKERRVLLILDNVEAHITIKTIDLARENGIVLLTLPPHTSHRLQPLDRAVYGPFKKAYNVAMDGWIRSHPGRTVTIYDIPTIVGEAQLQAMSQRNIKAGFAATGIYPYNRDIFTDADFAAAEVTDRQNPEEAADTSVCTENDPHYSDGHGDEAEKDVAAGPEPVSGPSAAGTGTLPIPGPSSSSTDQQSIPGSSDGPYVSPSAIYPFPKAQPRKTKGGRKKRATKILTDTPVRDEVAAEKAKKDKPTKTNKDVARKNLFGKKRKSKETVKETVNVTSDDDTEDDACETLELLLNDSEDDDMSDCEYCDELMEGDFVVVNIHGAKGTTRRYIARVDVFDDSDEIEGVFMKKIPGNRPTDGKEVFIVDHDDEASFDKQDIVKRLPTPMSLSGSLRKSNQLVFPCSLERFNLSY